MPSPFVVVKPKRRASKPWKVAPQGGLDKELHDIKRDIAAAPQEGDVSRKDMRWMKARKRAIKEEIKTEVAKERAAMKRG